MVRVNGIYKRIVNTKPRGFWPGFIVGLFYFGYIFWWFWSVHFLVSLGVENKVFAFLIILLPFLITVSGMSLFFGIFSWFVFDFSKKIKPIFSPFFFASVFALLEYSRAWFFAILWAGQESLLGPHWTFGNLAYLLTDINPIRQSASYWGIYGIDFLIVFFATAVLIILKFRRKGPKTILILQAFLVIAIFAFTGFISPTENLETDENKITISLIQTKNPIKIIYEPGELLADFSEKNRLLKEASLKSDIVVFPESTNFSKTLSGFLDFSSIPKYFNALSPKNVLIIDSNRIPEQDGFKSKAILIDSKDGIIDFYDKKLLTPGGETIPYLAKFPFLVFEYLWKNDFITSEATFSGGEKNNVLNYGNNKIELLICSDIISPGLSKNEEFDFIVNLNNLAVFKGNPLMEKQLVSMARFRAAENNKYLTISSNFGHSYVINPAGDIMSSTPLSGYQILTNDIVPNQKRTWYNKLGDIPILILSFITVLIGLKATKSRKF